MRYRVALFAAIVVAGGTKGKRYILPHAKMMIHQPYGEVGGQVSDIEIQAKDILDTRHILNGNQAQHTGQPIDVIARDTARDRFLSAIEAKTYGLVDDVLSKAPDLSSSGSSSSSLSSVSDSSPSSAPEPTPS